MWEWKRVRECQCGAQEGPGAILGGWLWPERTCLFASEDDLSGRLLGSRRPGMRAQRDDWGRHEEVAAEAGGGMWACGMCALRTLGAEGAQMTLPGARLNLRYKT